MDLTRDKWLPVVFSGGETRKISLRELPDNDILDVAWPRADFQGAAWQMLIGLLQCTVAPQDADDWETVWDEGIDEDAWEAGLALCAPAFQFGTEKPSFLQSFDPLDTEPGTIAGLLIEAPGGNTLKLNKDHFVKRGSVEQICPHCAVMALFSVQTNSPAGGAGYRVGMRGGGPLTTLVVPDDMVQTPLWKKLWLNVLPQAEPLAKTDLAKVFPWLVATHTSEKAGHAVTPDNAHLLQAYWGMPRRIELDFAQTRSGQCDLCGEKHDALLTQMRSKNYGVQYDAWIHPLSPYRQAVKDDKAPLLALKGQPGGLNYKDWLGLLLISEDKFNKLYPAEVVQHAARFDQTRLWCFAFDMDNAKARCWYQHYIPRVNVTHPEHFAGSVQLAVALAASSLLLLKSALKSARFEYPKEAKVDFSTLDIAFWQETEPAFYQLFCALAADPQKKENVTRQAIRQWETSLSNYLFTIFNREEFTDPLSPEKVLNRQLTAHRWLKAEYIKQKARKAVLAQAE